MRPCRSLGVPGPRVQALGCVTVIAQGPGARAGPQRPRCALHPWTVALAGPPSCRVAALPSRASAPRGVPCPVGCGSSQDCGIRGLGGGSLCPCLATIPLRPPILCLRLPLTLLCLSTEAPPPVPQLCQTERPGAGGGRARDNNTRNGKRPPMATIPPVGAAVTPPPGEGTGVSHLSKAVPLVKSRPGSAPAHDPSQPLCLPSRLCPCL